jgi:hypothetical protein
MEINVPLLRKTLEYADAHPEEIKLDTWAMKTACGTTACIAGTAVVLAGHEIDWNSKSLCFYGVSCVTDGRFIVDVAEEELGLTEQQANELFYCSSLNEVWEAAERLTDGEIRRTP